MCFISKTLVLLQLKGYTSTVTEKYLILAIAFVPALGVGIKFKYLCNARIKQHIRFKEHDVIMQLVELHGTQSIYSNINMVSGEHLQPGPALIRALGITKVCMGAPAMHYIWGLYIYIYMLFLQNACDCMTL